MLRFCRTGESQHFKEPQHCDGYAEGDNRGQQSYRIVTQLIFGIEYLKRPVLGEFQEYRGKNYHYGKENSVLP